MVTTVRAIATAMMILQLACVVWFHLKAIEQDGGDRAVNIGFGFMELADAASIFAIWIGR